MNLRFSARGDRHDAVVHLTVSDTLRFGNIVRRRGEALCRPSTSLPNLDLLLRQVLDARRCCRACIAAMARLRIKHYVALPSSAGILAGDLIRLAERERQTEKPRPQRRAIGFADD